jgi:uncharacterized protein YdhG (YjbR/CyaY superfamily)
LQPHGSAAQGHFLLSRWPTVRSIRRARVAPGGYHFSGFVAESGAICFEMDTALEDTMRDDPQRSKQVDAYIAAQPPEVQRALEELRACIWKAAPGVSELMNYNIPAFALVNGGKRDKQIMIAGYSRHVGFYPHPDTIEAFADQLAAYKCAKGSIQFPLNKPIPKALVIKMVKYRLSQLQE